MASPSIINGKTQLVAADKLKPHPANPRQGDVGAIYESIRANGFYGTIVVQKSTGYVLAGNHRLKAAIEAGIDAVPVVYVDVDDERAMRILLADNRTNDVASYDNDALADLLEHLASTDDGLTGTGYDGDALDDLLKDTGRLGGGDADPEAKVDQAEELRVKWGVEYGDLWQIGKHRLLCGDSTNAEDVARLMGGKRAAMCHTDPPYNVDYGSTKNPRHKIRSIENDSMGAVEWKDFVHAWGGIIKRFVDGDVYVWGASGPEGMRMRLWRVEMGLHWSATIVWKKQQLVLSPAKYQRMYEPCLYGWFGANNKSSFVADRKQTEVWEVDRPHDSKLHPTMKPVALCQIPIRNSSRGGDIVLDLFNGSGSTMIAAENESRTCYAMEIDPAYVAVCLERLSDMGLEPQRIGSADPALTRAEVAA